MKILICGMNYAPEPIGIGKYTSEMAEWLAEKGHSVRAIVSHPYYPQSDMYEDCSRWAYRRQRIKKVTILRCPIWVPKNISALSRLVHLLSFAISSLPVILFQAFLWRPDSVIVVAPNFACALGAWMAAKLSGAKAILHMQDMEIEIAFAMDMMFTKGIYRIACFIEGWTLDRFDRIFAVSQAMVEYLKKKVHNANKLFYFPNWVDTDEIFPIDNASFYRKEWSISENTIIALYSGSVGKKQELEIIIAAARLLSEHGQIKFVICGNGAVVRELSGKTKDLYNIVFHDLQPRARLNELLNLADIHLLPQRQDLSDFLMPSKLTGIYASGRPVVLSAQITSSLAALTMECGVVVCPNDAKAFAAAVLYLAEDNDVRKRLGRWARNYAVKNWSKEKVLSDFEKHLSFDIS